MAVDLKDRRIAFFGGDRRELEVADTFHRMGAHIRCVGLPWPDDVSWVGNVTEEVAAWADMIVCPVGGVDEFGNVLYSLTGGAQPPPRLTEEVIRRTRPGTVLFIGKAHPALRLTCANWGVRLVEFRERDDFAIRNAVPSAEGAIQMAMELMDVTLHQSVALVLGYGRTGSVLARMAKGIGADTWVAVRHATDLARIYAAGYAPVDLRELAKRVPPVDIVFNTVPAPLLREDVLKAMKPGAVIVDIASSPGGTDFAAAKRLGIRASLAPGLPGITAPRTAGRIVADTLLLLMDEMNL